MAIIADSHVHSSFSGDSQANMEDMVLKAIDLGLKYITFTEHQDFDFVYTKDEPEGMFEVNTDQYLYDLLKLREKYANKITVNFGIELGMQTEIARKNAIYAKSHDFDFIIASSHLCNRKDPYLADDFFGSREEKEAYHEYFKYILECIKTCRAFDVYGHLDYVFRYGPTKIANVTFDEYKDDIDAILKLLIQNEKGIEINTSGYDYGMNGPHPNKDIIMRYKELGGEIITIGSDAHKVEDIGRHFDKACELLKECGFNYYSVFDGRMPEHFKL